MQIATLAPSLYSLKTKQRLYTFSVMYSKFTSRKTHASSQVDPCCSEPKQEAIGTQKKNKTAKTAFKNIK